MLLRNSLWNLSGSALPSIAALATIPLLIAALGLEGFGIVTLIGSVIGYFAVLDINLTAGSIKYLAEHNATGERKRFAETFWFGVMFYGFLGMVGAALIYLSSDFLIQRFFEVSGVARADTILALKIAALGFAVSQMQNYLLVVPQALQRYDRSAQSEAFFGILVNVASVVVATLGGGIAGVTAIRVLIAFVNVLYLAWLIRRMGLPLEFAWPSREVRRGMTSFSAYAYLSKLASTLHQHGDKLIVGALAGPVALAFYTVPATLASRILGLTYRLSSVIYPRASELASLARMDELRPLYLASMRYITYINLVALGMIMLAGEEFLRRWVGEEFVTQGYPILVLMTIALLADSLTNVPSLVNDALGHPKVTGRFALARGLIGVGLVYVGTSLSGIVGAAIAHLLASVVLAALFLVYVHGRTIPISFGDMARAGLGRSLGIGLLAFAALIPLKWLMPEGLLGLALIVCIGMIVLTAGGLAFVMNAEERATLIAIARRFRSPSTT